MMLTEGQMNDHKGAALLLPVLPPAGELLGDRGYDSDGFREGLRDRGIEPCIPPTKNRKVPLAYDKVLYRQRHRIENAFGRMKDWRRATICAHAFFSGSRSGCRNESAFATSLTQLTSGRTPIPEVSETTSGLNSAMRCSESPVNAGSFRPVGWATG